MGGKPGRSALMVRGAVKMTATPPMGPVYLCLPADVLDLMNPFLYHCTW